MIHNLRLDASRITYGVIAVFPGTGDDSGQGAMDTLRVAFAGTFSATLEPSVRAQLAPRRGRAVA